MTNAQGKQFHVLPTKPVGDCLFEAVVIGDMHLVEDLPTSNDTVARRARLLRSGVVKQLRHMREEMSPFIDGNFESYLITMDRDGVWGGEPELLMASHVLKRNITVYVCERGAERLSVLTTYGEHATRKGISVLYNGVNHYMGLVPHDTNESKVRPQPHSRL
jgi:hypothetical protein